eukprot:g35019.t1
MAYRSLVIRRGFASITLLVDDGTARSQMLDAIYQSFDLSPDSRIILTDEEGCDVPLDSRLVSGNYSLEAPEEFATAPPVELSLEAGATDIMRTLLGLPQLPQKVLNGVIVQACSDCKLQVGYTYCEECEAVFCEACNVKNHQGKEEKHRQYDVHKSEAEAVQDMHIHKDVYNIAENLQSFGVPEDVQLLLMERIGIPEAERQTLLVPNEPDRSPDPLDKFTPEELITLDTEVVEEAKLKELQSSMAREGGVFDELEAEMAAEFGADTSEQAFTATETQELENAIRKERKKKKKNKKNAKKKK